MKTVLSKARQLALLLVLALIGMFLVSSQASATSTAWTIKSFTLEDGRTYIANVPSCEPAATQACVNFMATPRQVLVYLHGAYGPEDIAGVTNTMNFFRSLRPNTIFVYGVSANGTKLWDAGACCTFKYVDDVGYVVRVVQDVDANYAVNRNRVATFGDSNGGMMSLKSACERADVIKAGSSFAGTYTGMCNKTPVKVAQLHGDKDTDVPVNGGTVYKFGRSITFPAANTMTERMQPGQVFPVFNIAGLGHRARALEYRGQIAWLETQFVP